MAVAFWLKVVWMRPWASTRRGKGSQIGGAHFFQLAELEDALYHRVVAGKFFQGFLTGGGLSAARLARGRQLEGIEEHLAHLLGRTDVKGNARCRIDRCRKPIQLGLHVGQKGLKGRRVDGHAIAFHRSQHGRQGQLQTAVEGQQTVGRQAFFQHNGHTQGQGRRPHAAAPEGRAPVGGQTRPGIVAFFRINEVGGQPQVEAKGRLPVLRQALPAGLAHQQTFEVGKD